MKRPSRSLGVGIFFFSSVAVLIALVFILGRQQSLFVRKAHFHLSFVNTNGLVVGTPVRLAGVDIGHVEDIAFDRDLKQRKVHVKIAVDQQYADRIRVDSIATLASKGLLGDIIVGITVGSSEAAPLKDGETIRTQETQGLTEIIESVQEAVEGIKTLSGDVGERLKGVISEPVQKDIARIARSVANVTEQIDRGGGVAHSLIYDKRIAADVSEFVASLRRSAATIEKATTKVDNLLAQDDAKKALANLSAAAKQLADIMREVKEGHGIVHTLIYEEDRTNLLENLTALSKVLRTVGEDIDKGKGTIGGLLKDPTIYQDLKIILGNIERSRLLRALVRYTIKQDGLTP